LPTKKRKKHGQAGFVLLLLFPKADRCYAQPAGLLTYSFSRRLPTLMVAEKWPVAGKISIGAYSSGYCPGFSPDSLSRSGAKVKESLGIGVY